MEILEVRDLMDGCAVGEALAWKEFRARFEQRIEAGVRRGLGRVGMRYPPVEREDLVQEVYLKLLDRGGRSLRACRGEAVEAVSAYVGRVAETVTIDRVRSEVALKRGRGRVSPLPIDAQGKEIDLADQEMGPEQQLLTSERRSQFLERCREILGKKRVHRDLSVLYLACLEGWGSRDIAHAIGGGLTPTAVDSLVHRVRKRLAARGVGLPARRHAMGLT